MDNNYPKYYHWEASEDSHCNSDKHDSLCHEDSPCPSLNGIEVQLQGTNTLPTTIAPNAPVLFDTVVSSTSPSLMDISQEITALKSF